jgi:prepilin-type N-terminal cleavage/methylation domain-containing protein/prepilin-type processing-associated H-X9-DG protein
MKKILRKGFTLIEILVCIAIIAIVIAILLSVYKESKKKSYAASCVSNLKQSISATLLYSQDYDGRLPLGGDISDLFDNGRENFYGDQYRDIMINLPNLKLVLRPYLKSDNVWKCPSDFGTFPGSGNNWGTTTLLKCENSCYEKFGNSYRYRLEIALKNKRVDSVFLINSFNNKVIQNSETAILWDVAGYWHGSRKPSVEEKWYNIAFADGHVKYCTDAERIAYTDSDIN